MSKSLVKNRYVKKPRECIKITVSTTNINSGSTHGCGVGFGCGGGCRGGWGSVGCSGGYSGGCFKDPPLN